MVPHIVDGKQVFPFISYLYRLTASERCPKNKVSQLVLYSSRISLNPNKTSSKTKRLKSKMTKNNNNQLLKATKTSYINKLKTSRKEFRSKWISWIRSDNNRLWLETSRCKYSSYRTHKRIRITLRIWRIATNQPKLFRIVPLKETKSKTPLIVTIIVSQRLRTNIRTTLIHNLERYL